MCASRREGETERLCVSVREGGIAHKSQIEAEKPTRREKDAARARVLHVKMTHNLNVKSHIRVVQIIIEPQQTVIFT